MLSQQINTVDQDPSFTQKPVFKTLHLHLTTVENIKHNAVQVKQNIGSFKIQQKCHLWTESHIKNHLLPSHDKHYYFLKANLCWNPCPWLFCIRIHITMNITDTQNPRHLNEGLNLGRGYTFTNPAKEAQWLFKQIAVLVMGSWLNSCLWPVKPQDEAIRPGP